jgi:hypothetical protein
MSFQSAITSRIQRYGNTVSIFRDAGNISEKAISIPSTSSNPFMAEYLRDTLFVWDSRAVDGDIFQIALTEEYFLIANLNFLDDGGVKVGQKAQAYKCNYQGTYYQLVETVTPGSGKRTLTLTVKFNDYMNVSYLSQGDSLTPAGELSFDKIRILFSKRKLGTYVPKVGDRITVAGKDFQIDSLDHTLYVGAYQALCSPDKRV